LACAPCDINPRSHSGGAEAGYGNRTRVYSLGSCRSTIEPIPQEDGRHRPRSLGPPYHSKGAPGGSKGLTIEIEIAPPSPASPSELEPGGIGPPGRVRATARRNPPAQNFRTVRPDDGHCPVQIEASGSCPLQSQVARWVRQTEHLSTSQSLMWGLLDSTPQSGQAFMGGEMVDIGISLVTPRSSRRLPTNTIVTFRENFNGFVQLFWNSWRYLETVATGLWFVDPCAGGNSPEAH
jgi:hypothetical protein